MAEQPFPGMPTPGDYDSPDESDERKRRAEASLREERIRAVEAAILGTPGGREWLWGLLNRVHTFEQRFDTTGSPFENGFFAGEREVGVQLMRRFAKVSPQDFATMFVEHDRQ